MATKDHVLRVLAEREGTFVSGEMLGQNLSLSRTAIWKAVEQLRADGYDIDSVPHKGYCLRSLDNVLSATGIQNRLVHKNLKIQVFPSLSSTNTVLKQMAEEGAQEGTLLAAETQTQGKGRAGRAFYSPEKTGAYFSILLRPKLAPQNAGQLTVAAAVAAAEAIEALTGQNAKIKWVNDVFVGERKVCGILTEGAIDMETGLLQYAVVGIGINITPPQGGFPPELATIAGTIKNESKAPVPIDSFFDESMGTGAFDSFSGDLRNRLIAAVLDRLLDYYEKLPEVTFYEDYKSRMFLMGKKILVHNWDGNVRPARAMDLSPDFGLIVEYEDGTSETLHSGEVSVREWK